MLALIQILEKLWLLSILLNIFKIGEYVIPYKPVQPGIIVENSKQYYGDISFYQSFSEGTLVEEDSNSYSFKEPASPHYAAICDYKRGNKHHDSSNQ